MFNFLLVSSGFDEMITISLSFVSGESTFWTGFQHFFLCFFVSMGGCLCLAYWEVTELLAWADYCSSIYWGCVFGLQGRMESHSLANLIQTWGWGAVLILPLRERLQCHVVDHSGDYFPTCSAWKGRQRKDLGSYTMASPSAHQISKDLPKECFLHLLNVFGIFHECE
jgi:hypothetical protein